MYCEEGGKSLCRCDAASRSPMSVPSSHYVPLALALLGGLAVALCLVAAGVGLALGDTAVVAVVGVGGLVTVVGVDSHQLTTVVGSSALHVDSAGAVALAVTARAVDLAVVFGVEVDNLSNGSQSRVCDVKKDFIVCNSR